MTRFGAWVAVVVAVAEVLAAAAATWRALDRDLPLVAAATAAIGVAALVILIAAGVVVDRLDRART